MTPVASFLSRSALFKGAQSDVLEQLAAKATQRVLNDGQHLFMTGELADRFYLVESGWIKLYQLNPAGNEAVVALFRPGESFAEAALFGRRPYPVNAAAVGATSVIGLSYQTMVELIQHDSDSMMRLFSVIAARQHYLVRRIEQVALQSAPQRLGQFLLELAEASQSNLLELPYDKGLLANRLNMKGETFSRALNALRKEAGIACSGRNVHIPDLMRLRRFCQ